MKKSIVTLLFAFASTALFAQAISQQEAKQRAESFLQKRIEAKPVVLNTNDDFRISLGAKNAKAVTNTASDESPYYIFNAEDNQGYVIVSGDERAREILGYSETGNLSEETMPCGLRMLLDLYAQEIESLSDTPSLGTLTIQGTGLPTIKKANATRVNVSPLMSCQWGQSSPYNGQCPSSGYSRCIVGCAATASAQIMYYWGHQKGYDLPSTAIPAYTPIRLGKELPELPATTFDWASMKDAASSDAAAAKLCRYVGQALEMDYGTSNSEAWGSDVANAFRDYFGYDQQTRIVFRSDYNYDVFEQMIYDEIEAGRPVFVAGLYYSGSSWGGHGFVCDGYQSSNGYYHINWGWNGSSDGYFALSSLRGGGSGYDIFLSCIIGIQPPVEGHEYIEEESRAAVVDLCLSGSRTFTRESNDQAFEGLTIYNALYNHLEHNVELIAGLGVYDKEGNLLEIMDQAQLGRFDRYDGFGLEFTFGNLSMGKGLEDGTYFIRSISKGTTASDTWGLSENAEHNYITATIADNKLTLQPSIDLEITSVNSGRATITNHGTEESRGLLYTFSSSRLSKVVQSVIAGGETKTMSLGTSSVSKIAADFDGHHVLWASSASAQNIALTARAIDADYEGNFMGQKLLLDVSVTNNNATYAYNTQVTVKLCKEGSTTAVATKSFTPNVEAKGIQTERLEFDGLTYNQPYTITLTSGSYTVQIGEMTTSQPRTFYVYKVTPVEHKVVLGDVNLDGEVTIADVTALVNIILGKDLDNKVSLDNADANRDGDISIADVTAIVNIILNKE